MPSLGYVMDHSNVCLNMPQINHLKNIF
jgi:hypothetical protein